MDLIMYLAPPGPLRSDMRVAMTRIAVPRHIYQSDADVGVMQEMASLDVVDYQSVIDVVAFSAEDL